jgi:hypothetical protein
MLRQKVVRHAVVVYLGDRPLLDDGIHVLPARQWAESLGQFVK